MKFQDYFLLSVGAIFCFLVVFNGSRNGFEQKTEDVNVFKQRVTYLAEKAIADLSKISSDSLHIPRSIKADGTLKATSSRSWTSGFYSGILWQLYSYSGNEELKNAAILWQQSVEKEKWDAGTHDLGFKVYNSFGHAWKNTNNEEYKAIFLTAAKTLSTRFKPEVGAIRSWDHHKDVWQYPVIIDNMMNLEMLFEATKFTGDSSFYHLARQHAVTTLDNHFRKDNSSYHVVDYDTITGAIIQKNTHQGAAHESAWSRGQAWGLYGFTTTYRYTGEELFLEQAKKIANFIFTHPNLPADFIPYWDFDAPNIPNEPRDVSAATIAASGLIELSQYDKENTDKYLKWADHILTSLEQSTYQLETPPFFLQHSVGSIPGEFEMDAPIIYADYYYVEALLRRLAMIKTENNE